jgi:hypothetical protein
MVLALLAELLGRFTSRLVAVVSEVHKNAIQRSKTKATNTGIRFEDLVSAA